MTLPRNARRNTRLLTKAKTARRPGLHVAPPPHDRGREPLHRVVYVIDVPARNPRQAARRTHQILVDPQSLPPVLQVINPRGRVTSIDLASSAAPNAHLQPRNR